jgi:hypothetical protein
VCRLQPSSLRVVQVAKEGGDALLKAAASWHFAPPATHRYPPGSKVGHHNSNSSSSSSTCSQILLHVIVLNTMPGPLHSGLHAGGSGYIMSTH